MFVWFEHYLLLIKEPDHFKCNNTWDKPNTWDIRLVVFYNTIWRISQHQIWDVLNNNIYLRSFLTGPSITHLVRSQKENFLPSNQWNLSSPVTFLSLCGQWIQYVPCSDEVACTPLSQPTFLNLCLLETGSQPHGWEYRPHCCCCWSHTGRAGSSGWRWPQRLPSCDSAVPAKHTQKSGWMSLSGIRTARTT